MLHDKVDTKLAQVWCCVMFRETQQRDDVVCIDQFDEVIFAQRLQLLQPFKAMTRVSSGDHGVWMKGLP